MIQTILELIRFERGEASGVEVISLMQFLLEQDIIRHLPADYQIAANRLLEYGHIARRTR